MINPCSDSVCEPVPVVCPELVGKGGVEEVSVVASLVGRNVAVESYGLKLGSRFSVQARSEAYLSKMDKTKVAKIRDHGQLDSSQVRSKIFLYET